MQLKIMAFLCVYKGLSLQHYEKFAYKASALRTLFAYYITFICISIYVIFPYICHYEVIVFDLLFMGQ